MEIKGISIKGFKELKHGHGDSRTFEANIYIDTKRVGHTSNDGWGGESEYHFKNGKAEDDFYRRVDEWVREAPNDSRDADILIEELILKKEEEAVKKQHIKAGYPVTILCRKGKQKVGDYEYWNEEWYVGLRSEHGIASYVKREKIDEYKVV